MKTFLLLMVVMFLNGFQIFAENARYVKVITTNENVAATVQLQQGETGELVILG